MKKIFAILLCAVMVFSLAACSGQNAQNSQGSNSSTAESTPPESSSEPAEQSGESSEPASSETPSDTPSTEPGEPAETVGKTLVVYYSATNNTEAVAGYIADATGADLFELVPVEPYTSADLNWTDRDSRVSREHDDESLRVVELENAVPDNWDEYDTVFIGYPIWWGIAAWPTDTFVKANDFTGKTICPLITHGGSGFSGSLRDIARFCPNAKMTEGLAINGDNAATCDKDLEKWVKKIGLK